MDVDSGVIIGMDPHKRSATIEVLDRRERILGGARFTTGTAGYREMLTAGRAWPQRVWAVEGAGGIGKHLAQRLVADGEQVLDVPAKLSARARVFSTGQGRKTDVTDAHSIALVALRTPVLRRVEVDAENVALRLLVDRRDELGVARSQLINRIHKLLLELLPGGAKVFLTAPQAKALLATVRPRDIVGRTRRSLAAEKIAELAVIDKKIKATKKELTELITATGSGLLQLNGIGPSGAARLLGDVGDIARFPTKAHFASWNGTAPIDASSGDNNRHRLSRSGNRRINRVLHIMAIVQMRHDTEGRAYYRRKLAAGKTSMEAIRCLKRRLSDVVYRQMVADAQATTSPAEPEEGIVDDVAEVTAAEVLLTGPGGQAGTAAGSSATGSDPGTGSSEKSLPGPATSIVATRRRSRKTPVRPHP
ncbi:IS110 family transposase [Paenibacillus sp. TRM 82003]|uniref:IS110 family transposase n=1 Tax=Kineococcus sp. TRM81007 TaxID=2925831 RepID=UPI001F587C0B|nr:IS110 family transposase [Kineococcus sp. TRM81007]MCI2237245.1 IS110 family transposase [Kineococcus sp. TRM81007]MCI3919792.1 IS110 family transposase [Paenibacillus sp. TRM 82003]